MIDRYDPDYDPEEADVVDPDESAEEGYDPEEEEETGVTRSIAGVRSMPVR